MGKCKLMLNMTLFSINAISKMMLGRCNIQHGYLHNSNLLVNMQVQEQYILHILHNKDMEHHLLMLLFFLL